MKIVEGLLEDVKIQRDCFSDWLRKMENMELSTENEGIVHGIHIVPYKQKKREIHFFIFFLLQYKIRTTNSF